MPNVWLVRSPEYSLTKFREVRDLLNSFKGVLKFFPEKSEKEEELPLLEDEKNTDPSSTLEPKELTWFFERCNEFRKQKDIGDDEMVMLLTDIPNPYNYFNGIDFETGLNMMVQTSECDKYFPGIDENYPVAYHAAATVLIRNWFSSESEAKAMLNLMPKGCMMDFCGYKKDAKLKILTADISEEALKSMSKNKLDPNLISQTLRIFQGVRTEILFKKYNELIQPRPSKLTIEGVKKEIYLYEFSNKKLNLPTLSRAVYIFLLGYTKPDVGITTLELLEEDNINRLFDIYNQLFSNPLNRFDDMEYKHRRERVLELCDAKNHKKWEQLISKISKAFIDLLGPDLARLYIIQGGRGLAKKIVLDRKFVKGLSVQKTIKIHEKS
jgi:hypothetical protein